MRRELAALTAIGLFLGAVLIPPLWATDREDVGATWHLTPETDRPQIAESLVTIPVFRSLTVVSCELTYTHVRTRYDLGPPHEHDHLDLSTGGRMTVDFEIVTKTGTTRVDRRSTRVRNDDRGRWAWLGWVDSSGLDSGDDRYRYEPVAGFPLRVDPGDVLLFSVQFTGMPDVLGVERTETDLRRDRIFLWSNCVTCGSNGTPCTEL